MTTTLSTSPDAYALAVAIAAHLAGPSPWRATALPHDPRAPHTHVELRRAADGATIALTLGGARRQGRLTFHAGWPRYQDGQTYAPRQRLSITCAAARDPRALARDVERRLLAAYDPAYRTALDEVLQSDSATNEARAAAERIAEAIGAQPPSRDSLRSGEGVDVRGGPSRVRRLQVRPAYAAGCRVRVSFAVEDIDEPTALRLLALLSDKAAR